MEGKMNNRILEQVLQSGREGNQLCIEVVKNRLGRKVVVKEPRTKEVVKEKVETGKVQNYEKGWMKW